jgi:hypothetical protein
MIRTLDIRNGFRRSGRPQNGHMGVEPDSTDIGQVTQRAWQFDLQSNLS